MPTITFGGVGSGIDTEAIISGLLGASQGPLNRVKLQNTQTGAAISSLSDIGSLLAKLKDSLSALDTVQEIGSFKVSSSDKAVVASATGAAQAGSFEINVKQLASAYKAYSEPLGVSQSSQALNQQGTLSLSIGDQTKDLEILATDSLDTVIQKVNTSGLRLSASSFYDGSQFRMQIRGLDTGAENDVTLTENGTNFGFAANLKSTGQDAEFDVDGFSVTSKTNQVQGAISGVTLALSKVTTDADGTLHPVNVTVDSDPEAFGTKLKTIVDSYNAVVNKIHTEAGFGTVKGSNPQLTGDSSLRSITNQLTKALQGTIGTGKFQTLRSIGVELKNDGTLKLNSTTLQAAVAADPDAVAKVLAGDDDQVLGFADLLASVATNMTGDKGTLQARQDGLAARQKQLTDRADIEQKRLDRMEEMMRKQFTQMDQLVSSSQAQMKFLGG
jgi:flagellar hook-associated protein 2